MRRERRVGIELRIGDEVLRHQTVMPMRGRTYGSGDPADAGLPADQRRCALANRTEASDDWVEGNLAGPARQPTFRLLR